MSDQPRALLLAYHWSLKSDQGEYLFSSLGLREETAKELRRMHDSLVAGGFTDHGGERWKPPLGPSVQPYLEREASQQKTIDDMTEVLRFVNDFLNHCWRDVDMNGYSFEKLEAALERISPLLIPPNASQPGKG